MVDPVPGNRRHLPLEGAVNFRDLGGYPAAGGRRTRWQTLYRADGLAGLSDADLGVVAGLGLRTICDFRIAAERARKPDRLPDQPGLRVVERGFLPEGTLDMLERIGTGALTPQDIRAEVLGHYPKFIRDHADSFASVFGLLLEDGAVPLLLHCTSGKDRTGVAAALVLLALGVPRPVIVQDYVLTNAHRADIRHLFDAHVTDEALDVLTQADPAYIAAALDEIDRAYPSPEAFLADLGAGPAERAELRARLTE